MQSIKQVVNDVVSPYRGSEATYEMVQQQIRERYGDECADEFDPHHDAMPLVSWASFGYRVRKGSKALKSVTFVDMKDDDGKVVRKIRRSINLFHKRDVERIT